MIEVLNDRDVKKARRQHQCFCCLHQIPVGSPAHAQSNVYDGEAYTVYAHPACQDIMHEIAHQYYDRDDGIPKGCVREYLRKVGFEGTPEEYVAKGKRR